MLKLQGISFGSRKLKKKLKANSDLSNIRKSKKNRNGPVILHHSKSLVY